MNKRNIVGMIRLPWEPEIHANDRNFLRKLVVAIFSEEPPGKGGSDKASKFIYIAEETSVGNILLVRPARNYKGYDFVIHLDNWVFSNKRTNPKHDDIVDDLVKKIKYQMSPCFKSQLKDVIEKVYFCHDPDDLLDYLPEELLKPKVGLPIDALLKIIKWMFIEQDIRDWNYSGRAMLWNYIAEHLR